MLADEHVLHLDALAKYVAVDSIGECNIIQPFQNQGDVADGSDGTAGAFGLAEGRHVASMEERPVA
jgi:hypothetical protein